MPKSAKVEDAELDALLYEIVRKLEISAHSKDSGELGKKPLDNGQSVSHEVEVPPYICVADQGSGFLRALADASGPTNQRNRILRYGIR